MKTTVLDHGYVHFIECYGSDERIVEAARMSTSGSFRGWGPQHSPECASMQAGPMFVDVAHGIAGPAHDCNCEPKPGDEHFLKYLWRNKHTSPFEAAGATFEVMAPIVVFREWHRHRTQSYNEASARYTPLPDLNYVPTVDRLMISTDTANKQAARDKDAPELSIEDAKLWRAELEAYYERGQSLYEKGLRIGVPKELARLCLPVGRYSRMRVTANLLNWYRFLQLRMDGRAQWEIRVYAQAICIMLREYFPHSTAAYESQFYGNAA